MTQETDHRHDGGATLLLQNHIHKKIIIIKRREREREHAELRFQVWRPLLQEIGKLLKMTPMGVSL